MSKDANLPVLTSLIMRTVSDRANVIEEMTWFIMHGTGVSAGGFAGLTVDITLFPLDTLKTRLQSPHGFSASGGFRNLYKGVGTAAVGSIPTGVSRLREYSFGRQIAPITRIRLKMDTVTCPKEYTLYCDNTCTIYGNSYNNYGNFETFFVPSSVFFCTYNSIKNILTDKIDPVYVPIMHMGAASVGEIGSCLLKVPIEVVKQRQQASKEKLSPLHICKKAIEIEGYFGLYRGFTTTVLREIPFVLIQFPIWEWLKQRWILFTQKEIGVIEVAVCGALSGGVAAALTTPLDVAKTRIMLAEKDEGSSTMLARIYRNKGVVGLFSGFIPRTLWITIGGAVFFGAYQCAVEVCLKLDSLK